MSDHGRYGHGGKPPASETQDRQPEGYGDKALEGVSEPDKEASFDTDNAKHVAGTNVAAAVLADVVNAFGTTDEQADGNAAKKVGAEAGGNGDGFLAQRSSSSRRRARTSSLIGVPPNSYSLRSTFIR